MASEVSAPKISNEHPLFHSGTTYKYTHTHKERPVGYNLMSADGKHIPLSIEAAMQGKVRDMNAPKPFKTLLITKGYPLDEGLLSNVVALKDMPKKTEKNSPAAKGKRNITYRKFFTDKGVVGGQAQLGDKRWRGGGGAKRSDSSFR